ncbi:MAG: dihydrofolate reductase [bacterium]
MTLIRETNITLSIVVAMSENNCIGRDGGLPWRLSDDLKWFKKVTLGKPIIMGRVTFDSIGKALPGRDNIVVTRNTDFQATEVTVANDIEDAIAIGEAFALARHSNEICIIGGGKIYQETLPLVSKLYLTKVATTIEGDTFFPNLVEEEWPCEVVSRIAPNEKNDFAAEIQIRRRNDRSTL